MKYLSLFLLLLFCACDPEEDSPVRTDNLVRVSVNGQLYYELADNVFSRIDKDINSAGENFFDLVLFASGIVNEDEEFVFTGKLTSVSNPSELIPGINGITFTQVGNDCSGTLFTSPDFSNVDVSVDGERVTGKLEGTFSSTFGGCPTEFLIEFSNIKVSF